MSSAQNTDETPRVHAGDTWDRAAEAVDTGWIKAQQPASWVTEHAAPLTRWASNVDLLRVAIGVGMAALAAIVMSIAASIEWQISPLTSPLWLVVGAALLAGTVLGALRGFLAAVLYLGLGLIGAAWSAEGMEAYLQGPWAGTLLSLPLASLVAGLIATRHAQLRSVVTSSWYFFGWFFLAALAGMAIVYAASLWTVTSRDEIPGWDLFTTMSARFPFDAAQCLVVAIIAAAIHKAAPVLLRGGRRRVRQ